MEFCSTHDPQQPRRTKRQPVTSKNPAPSASIYWLMLNVATFSNRMSHTAAVAEGKGKHNL